jgi:Tol biopolymer transport system component
VRTLPRPTLLLLAVLLLALPASAIAAGVPDPDAPPDSPPHWLPGEAWVSNHWLPYDETRLYRLLRIKRSDVWQQLRDDRHNLAQLGRRRGWRPNRLAATLVAPWRSKVPSARLRLLRSRALRTLTQGHMAQHMFFHSLHQFAVPGRARQIFGLSRDGYLALRRAELSPIQIGMLYGRSPARVQAAVISTLRDRSRSGVRTRSTPARQARLLLSRQVSQVPRWLQQSRYNGPPQTHHHGPHRGTLVQKPRNYASNPAISADGSRVAYESYEQRVPLAVSTGEIGVFAAPVSGSGAQPVSSTAAGNPRSAYNAAISGTGRFVAFEIAAGNLNFAKRYGQIHVNVHDASSGKLAAVDAPVTKPGYSRSAFNPSLSDDGRRLAFSAVGPDGNTVIWVRDTQTEATDIATPRPAGAPRGDAYGGRLSGDGRLLVFTWVPRDGSASHVYLRDLTTGATSLVDRGNGANGAPGNGFASHPAVSADGRFVAFSSSARNLGASDHGVLVYVRDLKAGTTAIVSRSVDGSGFEPAISADGAHVAYTSTRGGRSRVLLHDRATGKTTAITDGRGISFDPSLSGDGTRVAFASNRPDLAPARSAGARSIYVRDLSTGRTTLVSGGPIP